MTNTDVRRKIAALERELESYEEQKERIVRRRMELCCRRAAGAIMERSRLELNGVLSHINELRLKIWGLKQLNLPD